LVYSYNMESIVSPTVSCVSVDLDTKLKLIRSNICKIAPSNFDIISNTILEINILENYLDRKDAIDFSEEEIKIMNKVVKIFIDATSMFHISGNNEGMEIPNVIASLFIKLRHKWAGHQGRVLSAVMVEYISNYLKDYCENSDELSDIEKLKCPKIILFMGMLYNRGMFQSRYCVGILVKFMNKDEQSITVFCNFLTLCFDKITSESEIKMFNIKKEAFKRHISDCSSDKSISSRIRFMAQDVMELFNEKGL
jgi:hypothetical protein